MDELVTTDWLAEHLDDPDLRIFDTTVIREPAEYSGGGMAASSDAFVLHRLGRDDVAGYDGSLRGWVADPSLPLVSSD